MNEINIARTITNKRKEKSLTQEDLANFMGVTKASVSKWETSQSYPDIFLLPRLAAFFNISIDDLMGYEPQMIEDDVRKLYKELSHEFANKPFEDVMSRCREITKKYFSCFPLLLQMGILYINYGNFTIASLDENQKASIASEAKELFIRVKQQSPDVDLQQMALHLIATCEILLGNPDEVIRLFESAKNKVPSSNEVLLSQAYLMTGKVKEAKTELQSSIFDSITSVVGVIPSYMALCTDDTGQFEEICKRTIETIKLWGVKDIFPAAVIPFYLSAATGYTQNKDTDKALDMLEEYVYIATNNFLPITIKRDDFFNLIKVSFDDLPFGTADTPRDEKSIKQSLVDGIASNPAFAPLHENQRFQNLVKRITNNINHN